MPAKLPKKKKRPAHPETTAKIPRKSRQKSQRKSPRNRANSPRPGLKLALRRPIKTAIVLTITVFSLAFLISFLWLGKRVAERLNRSTPTSSAGVYSAALNLSDFIREYRRNPGSSAGLLPTITKTLLDKRYREVPGTPSAQGEFRVSDNNLSIYTRGFTLPSEEVVEGALFTTTFQPSPNVEIFLEPERIASLGDGDTRASRFVPLEQIPKRVQDAVVGIEDERFYSHFGLDIAGILRAVVTNIKAGRLVQGGSTLTQQLAKNLILSPKKTLSRKLLEIPAAISLERHLSKPQLLELYLNEVYLGQEGATAIHGFPEAARAFFGKSLAQLSLAEIATLAGIIKAPSALSPRRHRDRATERRNTVLEKLKELGTISEEELQKALKERLTVAREPLYEKSAQYFIAALQDKLEEGLESADVRGGSLTVLTGFDLNMQRCAEKAVENGVSKLPGQASLQAALVAIEPHSGLIKSWVGGRDYGESQFDRVTQSKRQIGSTVKPFLYLTALDPNFNSYKAATAASILEDKPMEVSIRRHATWIPENYDKDFRGDVTLRYALEHSLNMPAVYVAQRVGMKAVKRTLESFNVAKKLAEVPSLALGAVDATLLDLTTSYGALANGGVWVSPRLYTAALSEGGERLLTAPVTQEQVGNPDPIYVLTDILQGVLTRGTGVAARRSGFSRDAAGKTGTSDSGRDLWFIGYTPTLVVGVWVGHDDNSPTSLTGSSAAAPIWGDFMKCASPFFRDASFVAPAGVELLSIDSSTGRLATAMCPEKLRAEEIFVNGTGPTLPCTVHSSDNSLETFPKLPESSGENGRSKLSPEKPESRQESFWDSIFGG